MGEPRQAQVVNDSGETIVKVIFSKGERAFNLSEMMPSSPITSGIVEGWKVLAEKGALSGIYDARISHPGVDRGKAIKEALQKALSDQEAAPGAVNDFTDLYFEDDNINIFYGQGKTLSLVRITRDYFVDYLTGSAKISSFFNQGLRVDILLDSAEAGSLKKELIFYRAHPEFYQLIYKLNSDNLKVSLSALDRLEGLLKNPVLRIEAERLLTAALGIDNWYIQTKAQDILNRVYSGRPLEFPAAQETRIVKLGENIEFPELIISAGFNPLKEERKLSTFKARIALANNYSDTIYYYDLKIAAASDNSLRLKLDSLIKVGKGIIHLAVQIKENEASDWEYVDENKANVIIFCQKDIRGAMIYQAWPACLGIYGDDGKVIYDEKGRAIPGNFGTIEKILPQLSTKGYRYIYVMGVYQLDRPENIIGQVGPDASLFSPLSFKISRELGGEEGLRKLVEKARDEFGIEIIVDLIPHVNQNFTDLPEWAIVRARAAGKVIRR